MGKRVGVIGGGMAGLACARRLAAAGLAVTVFDKGRGPGGRMSARRRAAHGTTWDWNHGAQYFTARHPAFRELVHDWEAAGVVRAWSQPPTILGESGPAAPTVEPSARYAGVPAMNQPAKELAATVGANGVIHCGIRVAQVVPKPSGWELRDADGADRGTFDRVVVAVPAPQAVPLLGAVPHLAEQAAGAEMQPTLTGLFGFAEPLPTDIGRAFVNLPATHPGSALAWMARAPAEAASGHGESWVVHATHAFSRQWLHAAREQQATALRQAFAAALDLPDLAPAHAEVHGWHYAAVASPIDRPCLYDPAHGLGACGDWCLGNRVEAAFLSGDALADAILGVPR